MTCARRWDYGKTCGRAHDAVLFALFRSQLADAAHVLERASEKRIAQVYTVKKVLKKTARGETILVHAHNPKNL
jgi:hypothetical protein